MARLIDSPTGGGPVGTFEQTVVDFLVANLPHEYGVMPNFSLRQESGQSYEYDVVVFAPHGIYVVEAKEWYGRLTGDDTEWLLNQSPRKCPLWLVERKGKVLKSCIGAPGRQAWFEPLMIVPDGIQNDLGGEWAKNLVPLHDSIAFLRDPSRLRFSRDISDLHAPMLRVLQGLRGKRLRGPRNRVGGYEMLETLYADEDHVEYRAQRALFDDPSPYRVRVWHLSGYASPDEREARLNRIRRPTEALAKIGRHPNLLQILEFNEVADDTLFYEVTEWSDFGTLHGYLNNQARDRLTLRERLEIAAGVASALEAVHARDIVHRDVRPETILIAFDRHPRLTDFDRAYIEDTRTVFPGSQNTTRNPAYVAPELRDATDYDFDACSDMYSFGVLLYEILTGTLPFEGADMSTLRARPSELREGVDARIDELVDKLLLPTDFRARPSAQDALAVLQEVLGSSVEPAPRGATEDEDTFAQAFELGNVVDDVFRIDAELGSGAFSKVYKVFHLDHGIFYAMKVLTRPEEADIVLAEFDNGKALPTHPNIAQVVWQARLRPPAGTPYILSEFVEGEPLTAYCKGEKRLPWQDIQQVGLDVLDALAAMHPKTEELDALKLQLQEQSITDEEYQRYQQLAEEVDNGILHRDIKPANILLESAAPHRAKLIDFNISSKLIDAKGRGGTPRYWAPDRGQPEWRADMDLFSLGVVLYELVTQHHPFPDDNPESGADPIDPREAFADLHLSDELAKFLFKACATRGADRFRTARQMQEALLAVDAMHAPPTTKLAASGTYPGITLLSEETGKTDYNPYVARLLTLYSQASRTNAGTRGLDDIAKLTYVNTRLDTKLAPKIADGAFRLVIVTGNAGDGKTAFLQKVESLFRDNLALLHEIRTRVRRWDVRAAA